MLDRFLKVGTCERIWSTILRLVNCEKRNIFCIDESSRHSETK